MANIMEDIANEMEASAGNNYLIDLSKDYPEPKYTLCRNGIGTMPRGDIQFIKAKSKNGKSFLCAVLMASFLGCEEFGFTRCGDAGRVLYFDTEQNERNTAKLAKRVHTLLGWETDKNHPNFKAYTLRKVENLKRLPFIEKTIKEEIPQMVFVDGISDLIDDFNDVGQSSKVINDMMRISAENDCALCCVQHTNKKADDNGMKGHVGTLGLQKSSDVFEVKKDGNKFNVTETDCRNVAIEDFSFVIDSFGIPHKGGTVKDEKMEAKKDYIRRIFAEAFNDKPQMTYTELVEAYQLHGAVQMAQAKNRVKDAKDFGIIRIIPGTKYYELST